MWEWDNSWKNIRFSFVAMAENVREVQHDVMFRVWQYLAACIFMRWRCVCVCVCDSDGIWGGCESNMGATCATDTPAPLRSVYIQRCVYHIIPRRENALAVSLLWSSLKVMGRDERNINLALCITARESESERSAPHQRQQTLFFPWDSSAIFTSFEHPHYPRVHARTRSSRQNPYTPFRWGCCVRCPAGGMIARALFYCTPPTSARNSTPACIG